MYCFWGGVGMYCFYLLLQTCTASIYCFIFPSDHPPNFHPSFSVDGVHALVQLQTNDKHITSSIDCLTLLIQYNRRDRVDLLGFGNELLWKKGNERLSFLLHLPQLPPQCHCPTDTTGKTTRSVHFLYTSPRPRFANTIFSGVISWKRSRMSIRFILSLLHTRQRGERSTIPVEPQLKGCRL